MLALVDRARQERSMNSVSFSLAGEPLEAFASGALHWPTERMLIVSDLHLGKSERIARRGGALLPPYDTAETLERLQSDIQALRPQTVLCLGDSFDDLAAAEAIDDVCRATLLRLQAGRNWLWVEGNHDPGPVDLGGSHVDKVRRRNLVFRHIAIPDECGGEVSGHYHPKARLRGTRRPCFLTDGTRLIMPAYGAYTGGLDWTTPVLRGLLSDQATAFLTGRKVLTVPVPRNT